MADLPCQATSKASLYAVDGAQVQYDTRYATAG